MAFLPPLRGRWRHSCTSGSANWSTGPPPGTRGPLSGVLAALTTVSLICTADRPERSIGLFWTEARLWRLLAGRPGRLSSQRVVVKLLFWPGVEPVAGSLIETAATLTGRGATADMIRDSSK